MNTARVRKRREAEAHEPLEPIVYESESFGTSITRRTFYFLLFFFPLLFGGVHPQSFLPTFTCVFFVTAFLLYPNQDTSLPNPPLTSTIGKTLIFSSLYFTLIGVWGSLFTVPHPILGEATDLVQQRGFVLSVITLMVWGSTWYLTTRFCTTDTRILTLIRLVSLSGLLIASVALSHWFYDTGKLFGIFEPQTVTYSNRARWPFVSSNNLGQYLVVTFFPTLLLVIKNLRKLLTIHDSLASRRTITLIDILNNQGVQPLLIAIAIDCISLFAISLAILGSQSRGSWIGLSIMFVLFVAVDRWFRKNSSDPSNFNITSLRNKRRMARPLEGLTFFDSIVFVARKFSLVFAAILSISLVYLYLQGRGLELVLDRAEYGLLSSKDDIRWVMYADTLKMIMSYPLFGVGLGAWDQIYAQFASPELARLNPVYLHSDPLQLLAEVGIVGFIPFCYLVWVASSATIRALSTTQNSRYRAVILGTFCGMTALLISSLFDFPFRLPSITLTSAILLGILTSAINTAFERDKKVHEEVDFNGNNPDSI